MASPRAFVLLVLATVVSGLNIQQARTDSKSTICGRSHSSGDVGGTNPEFRQPWRVELHSYNDVMFYSLACGGALVTEKFVITAAHCVDGPEWYLTTVRIGDHGIDKLRDSHPYEDYRIRRKILHERFERIAGSRFINDLALLELTASVRFSQHIQPICLPQPGQNFAGASASISGRQADADAKESAASRKLDMMVMRNDNCEAWYLARGPNTYIRDSTLCASSKVPLCGGTRILAGSPLVLERDGQSQAIAIVSWSGPCDTSSLPRVRNAPMVLTNISHHMMWIHRSWEASSKVPEIGTENLYLVLYVFIGVVCYSLFCWAITALSSK